MKRVKRLLSLSLYATFGMFASLATASDFTDADSLESFVDGYVKPSMVAEKSASGTVAIAHKGELIFAKGYGFQDIENRKPVIAEKTLFRPGSVSKLFAWVAVMQQVEQGNLNLDTDVNAYLEGFQIDDTWPGQPVTLRHILTHTAGFEDGAVGYLIVNDPNNTITLAEAMEKYQPYRINPPGAQTAYSNYATALAGLIVETVSGVSFSRYIQENIFDVLGMSSSSFEEPLPEDLNKNMAIGYLDEGGAYVAKPFELVTNFSPAGGMSATSTDMIKFGQAMLNGGELNGKRILQQSTVDQMLTREFSHDERVPGMGLGFYQTQENGILLYGHGGDTTQFHSELVIDQKNQIVLFVSFSGNGGSQIRGDFKPSFYNQFFPVKDELLVAPEGFSERAAKYSGTYKFWRSSFSKFEKAMGLMGGISVTPLPDDTLLIGMGESPEKFVEVDKNLFKPADTTRPAFTSLIAFQENESGEITGFVAEGLPFMSTYKASAYQTTAFNGLLVTLSILMFIAVWLRYFYQRQAFKSLPKEDKSARKATLIASAANLVTLVAGVAVLAAVGGDMMFSIPTAFKVWLVLPIVAFIAGLYAAFSAVQVWRNGLLGGVSARVRYSLVALSGLFMCWFYWYWNILGFQYFS